MDRAIEAIDAGDLEQAAYITGTVIRVDGGYGLNTASLAAGR
jgi:hypothetical protein